MKARDIMTTRVITTTPDARVSDAVDLMLKHRISGLPVVNEQGKLMGLLVESDLVYGARSDLPAHLQLLENFLNSGGTDMKEEELAQMASHPVSRYMTRQLVTATPDASVRELVEIMVENDFKRIPIIQGDFLKGIVTRADILKVIRSGG